MYQYDRHDDRNGFTLIEIVLVLALAALLLIIVFLAVVGAQQERRDYTRKQDVGLLTAQGLSYASDHNDQVPQNQAEVDVLRNQYFPNHIDPRLQTAYTITFRSCLPFLTLKFWDEEQRKLVGLKDLKAIQLRAEQRRQLEIAEKRV